MKMTKEELERYADKHLNPDHEVDRIDAYCASLYMKRVLPLVKGNIVLEMGAGSGYYTEECIKLYGHSYIVDASLKLLTQAKNKYQGSVTCFESFFEEFNPPDNLKFNTILATHVFEHFEDTVLFLKKARNWLAPGGRIIIQVPNAESIHRKLGVIMGLHKSIYDLSARDIEVGHVRVYDLDMLRDHVHKAGGYKIVLESGMNLKTAPLSLMKAYPDALLKALVDISDEIPSRLLASILMVIETE